MLDFATGDGETLLSAGSAPTAHALAVLALEETGKALLCHLTAEGHGALASADRKAFMKAFRHHETKLRQIRPSLNIFSTFQAFLDHGIEDVDFPDVTDEEWQEQLDEQVNGDLMQKMRGFYVDLTEDDAVQEPSQITEDDARDALFISTAARLLVSEFFQRGGVSVVDVVDSDATPTPSP